MRRNDREITNQEAIEAFIAKEQILRIAFCEEGDIYIVPVNYGYTCENGRYTFFFHGAKAGRKYELAKSLPKVGFEIDGKYTLLEGESACEFSATFQSVIGTGTLCLVSDRDEKIQGLNAIMKQTTGKADWSYEDAMLEAVAVFRLDVEKMSCKAK
ncbi:MAG: pyridoxamine 5'-phosphate oxidase family protein [Lachnospiraceae bacterium]|nr:pyridoxamine 5'-phosphate oxidase family protein [Lachnospiraceae bacterium]